MLRTLPRQSAGKRCVRLVFPLRPSVYAELYLVHCHVQETLPVSPTEADVAKAQSRLADCVGDCAAEYGKQLPKLKADIHAQIKQLTRSR